MGILSIASAASKRRGYDYYKRKKVISFSHPASEEYEGVVSGSGGASYQVKINVAHVRQSACSCPFAAGRRIICKHMVALYFTAFPDEAKSYIAEVKAAEREMETRRRRQEEFERQRREEIERYVMRMTKRQLQETLLDLLLASEFEVDGDEYEYE